MYKTLPNDPLTDAQSNFIIRLSDNSHIGINPENTDYQTLLDDINEFGSGIVEGDLPDSVLTEASEKKFQQQLAAYKTATSRLEQYVLSVGVNEVREMVPGIDQVFNQETNEMEPVLVERITPAIDPLPATVTVSKEDGTTEEIRNPAIVKDEEERAAAQAIIDATPEEVKAAA